MRVEIWASTWGRSTMKEPQRWLRYCHRWWMRQYDPEGKCQSAECVFPYGGAAAKVKGSARVTDNLLLVQSFGSIVTTTLQVWHIADARWCTLCMPNVLSVTAGGWSSRGICGRQLRHDNSLLTQLLKRCLGRGSGWWLILYRLHAWPHRIFSQWQRRVWRGSVLERWGNRAVWGAPFGSALMLPRIGPRGSDCKFRLNARTNPNIAATILQIQCVFVFQKIYWNWEYETKQN